MSPSRPSGSTLTKRVLALGSMLAGPGGAWLYEAGWIDVFGPTSLTNLWIVVAMALAGVGMGVYAIVRGCKLTGTACVLINLGVGAPMAFSPYSSALAVRDSEVGSAWFRRVCSSLKGYTYGI